jgi:quinol monooxygenase YgiN
METVGRYVKFTAKDGGGEALAQKLLAVAEGMEGVPGCELYVVNRVAGEPDVVWVTELWRSQEDVDSALDSEEAKAAIPGVMALVASAERVDLQPLGGAGHSTPGSGHTKVNLDDVEDVAPKYGYADMGQARFAGDDLGAVRTGVSFQRLNAGKRQMFGHRHRRAEEIYVVVGGSGRVKVGEEISDVGPLDAIRVAPDSTRAFEAGPDGLEILALGPHHAGDGVVDREFWPL